MDKPRIRVLTNHLFPEQVLVDGYHIDEHITVILEKEEADAEMISCASDYIIKEFNKKKCNG